MPEITLTWIENPDAPAGASPALADYPADTPHVLVTDLGINRGDGIFEVAGCLGGRIQALDAHLRRLKRSAAMLDLPTPNAEVFAAACRRCVDALTAAHPDREIAVKIIYTRGQEMGASTQRPVAWAMAYLSHDFGPERQGIAVITLDRGVASDVAGHSPWLLYGAKTLSYAVNRGVIREAHSRGADDVLFVSSDGHALEGPSSSLIARIDGVWVTPPASEGILPGTTQADLFTWATGRGIRTETRPLELSELEKADALWLTSSSRLAAPVKSLDDRALDVDAALTDEMNAFLLARG